MRRLRLRSIWVRIEFRCLTTRVALLTDREHPGLTADDKIFRAALEARHCSVEPAQWADPAAGFDIAVIRSCWDYQESPGAFVKALEIWSSHCRVVNPVDTVRWNIDKRYLLRLQSAGVKIPPTVVVAADSRFGLEEVLGELGIERAVVKPAIGASGIDTWLTGSAADRTLWEAGAREDRLVQQFLPEIVSAGELSLIHFSSGYSHAVVKQPASGEFRVQVEHGGSAMRAEPPASVVAASEQVLQALEGEWSSARVDGVVVDGEFVLMELELIEPDLFFRANPTAADRLAAVVVS